MNDPIVKLKGIAKARISEARLRAHVLSPQNVREARCDRGPQTLGAPLLSKEIKPSPQVLLTLNVANFQDALAEALYASFGYCWQLRQHGASIAQQTFNLSQTYDVFGIEDNTPWTLDTPMHIASLSKNITAMVMTQILNSLGLPQTTAISGYLPTHWSQGPNINLITFSNLLTHTSGFTSGATDYQSMKSAIAAGVTTHGQYQYENMNFSLCRILLSVLNGTIAADFSFGGGIFSEVTDLVWDLVTIDTFDGYVTTNVLTPAGSGGHLVHQFGDALAYDYPPVRAKSAGAMAISRPRSARPVGTCPSTNCLMLWAPSAARAISFPPYRRRQCLTTVLALIGS